MNKQEFIALFSGRNDAYAIQKEDGSYCVIRENLTEDIYNKHLNEELTVGIFPINKENRCKFTAIDLDSREKNKLINLINTCIENNILFDNFILSFSGKKGFHIYIPFKDWIPAEKAKRLGDIIVKMFGDVAEVFPKQDSVPEGGLGALIKLPCGIHRVTNKKSVFLDKTFNKIPINKIKVKPISETRVDEIIGTLSTKKISQNTGINYPCTLKMMEGVGEGCRDEIAFRLAIRLYKAGMPKELAHKVLLEEWNPKNKPPIEEYIIINKIEQGYTGKYGLGCYNNLVQTFCDESCRIYNRIQEKYLGTEEDILECIPDAGLIKDYMEFSSSRNHAPIQFHLLSCLTLISTIVGTTIWTNPFDGNTIYPNIYCLFVADSGIGKDTAIDISLNFLRDINAHLILPEDFVSREALIDSIKETPEGLLVFKEFADLLNKAKKEQYAGVMSLVTQIFDCPPIFTTISRTKGSQRIEKPKLNIAAASTPDWLTKYLKESDMTGGFLSRFIIIYAGKVNKWRGISKKDKEHDNIKSKIITKLNVLQQREEKEADFSLVEGKLNDWMYKNYTELDKEPGGFLLRGFWVRLSIYAMKLAMLYQISFDNSNIISEEAMDYAIKLIDYIKKCTRYVVTEQTAFSEKQIKMAKIYEMIKNTELYGVSHSKLLKLSKIADKFEFQRFIDTLMEQQDIITKRVGKGVVYYAKCYAGD